MPESILEILVVESEGFSPEARALLQSAAQLRLANLDRPGLLREVDQADVLWVRLRHQIDAEVMDGAPRLKIIVTATTGRNHIDLREAERRGIQVISLLGEAEELKDVRATAEHTISLMLALLRHLPTSVAHVRQGNWNRDLFKGHELYQKTAGIIGYGRLGRIVARYLRAFEMKILACDPFVAPPLVEPEVSLVALPDLLAQSDIVSLHVNLSEGTRFFFGPAEFAAMKRGAWFINTARGELLDEHALLAALQAGQLRGAAVDVLSDEHLIEMAEHPLVDYAQTHDHLLITPHLGGCTYESMAKTELLLAKKLCARLKTQESPGYSSSAGFSL